MFAGTLVCFPGLCWLTQGSPRLWARPLQRLEVSTSACCEHGSRLGLLLRRDRPEGVCLWCMCAGTSRLFPCQDLAGSGEVLFGGWHGRSSGFMFPPAHAVSKPKRFGQRAPCDRPGGGLVSGVCLQACLFACQVFAGSSKVLTRGWRGCSSGFVLPPMQVVSNPRDSDCYYDAIGQSGSYRQCHDTVGLIFACSGTGGLEGRIYKVVTCVPVTSSA